ncbi:FAD:protein FMN transferase, partial [bacterium]|nr:FAD:protein FMN transferase [bacterium]
MSRYRSATFRITAIALLAMIAFWGCRKKVESPAATRDVLGTQVTIVIYDRGMTQQHLTATFDGLFDMMADWEKKVLRPGPDNQIVKIAESAGEKSVPIDDPLFDMLMEAIRLYDLSGETFDIRYGPMLDAWGFDSRPQVPSPVELDSLKSYVGQGGMFVAGKSILLAKKGMRFDAREIAIGYAFDMAAEKLAEAGIRTAMICCPRVCRTMGDPPNRRGFEMPLANPLNPSEPWGTLRVPVGGIAYASVSADRFSAAGKSY